MELNKKAILLSVVLISSSGCAQRQMTSSDIEAVPTSQPPSGIEASLLRPAEAPLVPGSGRVQSDDTSFSDISVFCGEPGADSGIESLVSEFRSASLAIDSAGGRSLQLVDFEGHVATLGCMSRTTAEISLELDLSFGSVLQIDERIVLTLAVPADRRLRQMAWLYPIVPESSANGFSVGAFEVVLDQFSDELTPTEEQIRQLALASLEGSISTGGFGPDLLEIP